MQNTNNWQDKDLQCTLCGTFKSVKYMIDHQPYCTICITTITSQSKGNFYEQDKINNTRKRH